MHENELLFIYNKNKTRDRKILARTLSMNKHVNEVDISKTEMTESQLAKTAKDLEIDIRELLDPRVVENNEITDNEGALKLIKNNPEILKTPIILSSEETRFIEDFSDLIGLDNHPAS